ncbi:hypothetical protein EYF80_057022 [Liparis tanakae]|uniref:Uncharacterized protein n=1 Tax=Liparis tanakae TaxID=230148 RepID=A0A4Z2EW70_9TELE|nr:hypothetical protein EYF80_057022 [Liparis tanakae]
MDRAESPQIKHRPTSGNKGSTAHFKAAIFLLCALLPGRLRLALRPRPVRAELMELMELVELMELLLRLLSGLQAEAGSGGSGVQTALRLAEDLVPLSPEGHRAAPRGASPVGREQRLVGRGERLQPPPVGARGVGELLLPEPVGGADLLQHAVQHLRAWGEMRGRWDRHVLPRGNVPPEDALWDGVHAHHSLLRELLLALMEEPLVLLMLFSHRHPENQTQAQQQERPGTTPQDQSRDHLTRPEQRPHHKTRAETTSQDQSRDHITRPEQRPHHRTSI